MKADPSTMKLILKKREVELQKIIRQMRSDKLQTSPVFRNLEQELETLRGQLTDNEKRQ